MIDPPYIVVSEQQWLEIADAIEQGRDHPLAIEGVPIKVVIAESWPASSPVSPPPT